MLGLDPLYVANEGILVAFVAPAAAERALLALRAHPLGIHAARIGPRMPAALTARCLVWERTTPHTPLPV